MSNKVVSIDVKSSNSQCNLWFGKSSFLPQCNLKDLLDPYQYIFMFFAKKKKKSAAYVVIFRSHFDGMNADMIVYLYAC